MKNNVYKLLYVFAITLISFGAGLMASESLTPLPSGMCDVILHYTIVYENGKKEPHEKWLDRNLSAYYVRMMTVHDANTKAFWDNMKSNGVSEIADIKEERVAPYDCRKGPK